MLTREQARELAVRCIERMSAELAMNDKATKDRELGWVFYYQSKAYLKSGDILHAVAGNGPLYVNKHDGSMVVLTTMRNPDKSMIEYEQQWTQARARGEPPPQRNWPAWATIDPENPS